MRRYAALACILLCCLLSACLAHGSPIRHLQQHRSYQLVTSEEQSVGHDVEPILAQQHRSSTQRHLLQTASNSSTDAPSEGSFIFENRYITDPALRGLTPSVAQSIDTLWTLPSFATPLDDDEIPHFLSFDVTIDPSQLHTGDYLKIYNGGYRDGLEEEDLMQAWYGGDPNAGGVTTAHVDVYYTQATFKLHREPSSSNISSTGAGGQNRAAISPPQLFVTNWTMTAGCPDGYRRLSDHCELRDSTHYSVIIIILPGVILVIMTVIWLMPRAWRKKYIPKKAHPFCLGYDILSTSGASSKDTRKRRWKDRAVQEGLIREEDPFGNDEEREERQRKEDGEDGEKGEEKGKEKTNGKDAPEREAMDDNNDGEKPPEKTDDPQDQTRDNSGLPRFHYDTPAASTTDPTSHSTPAPTPAVAARTTSSSSLSTPGPGHGPATATAPPSWPAHPAGHAHAHSLSNGASSASLATSTTSEDGPGGEKLEEQEAPRKHGCLACCSRLFSRDPTYAVATDSQGDSRVPGAKQPGGGGGGGEFLKETFVPSETTTAWSKRLRYEVRRTMLVFLAETIATVVNITQAVLFVVQSAADDPEWASDSLALAYLCFAFLAFLGYLVNLWSRVCCIRELKHEMQAALQSPLKHQNAHNSTRVAPQVLLAFEERRIHHLKVIGLTLLVESLPFAGLGFGKLYEKNDVHSNLSNLISCAVSAFWSGVKITRLITIPLLLDQVRKLEEDAQDNEDCMAYRKAKKRKQAHAKAGLNSQAEDWRVYKEDEKPQKENVKEAPPVKADPEEAFDREKEARPRQREQNESEVAEKEHSANTAADAAHGKSEK
jgi:hypothetical protein